MKKNHFLLFIGIIFFFKGCGTIYIPQILPEARGVGQSVGQENISVEIIPLTNDSLISANQQPYIRRVIDGSNLNQPAQLVSATEAIAERLPNVVYVEPYRLGVGDEFLITQSINVTQFSDNSSDNSSDSNDSTKSTITARNLRIADDGFLSILGVGRLPIEGLTQFEAEDLIYKALVSKQKNPEFELQISKFGSKKIYLSKFNEVNTAVGINSSFIVVPFTNTPIYLHQLIPALQPQTAKGQDSLIILKRDNEIYRMSLKAVLDGRVKDIRILAEDRIFVEPLPYRPEQAILTGEVIREKLIPISSNRRQTLAEALYGDGGTIVLGRSDTSQIFVIRELEKLDVVAYHLDSSNPARLTLATKFELRPSDIIYVAPQFVTNYNRALIQIFSALAITTNPPLAAQ
jgi:polysaccharide export outer membrane protein